MLFFCVFKFGIAVKLDSFVYTVDEITVINLLCRCKVRDSQAYMITYLHIKL